jgi:ParB-like chromosome segregation protein Spo0J
MNVHPAALIFPEMQPEEYSDLVASIKQHGQRESITLCEGQILDGRHRWRACEELGLTPVTHNFTGTDPVALVIALNLHRRHLSTSQRAMIGARARDYYDQQAKKRMLAGKANPPNNCSEGSTTKGDSRDQAGAAVGVSGGSIDRATRVLEQGIPELIAAVDAGKLTVSAAKDIATLPPAEQKKNHSPELPSTRTPTTQPYPPTKCPPPASTPSTPSCTYPKSDPTTQTASAPSKKFATGLTTTPNRRSPMSEPKFHITRNYDLFHRSSSNRQVDHNHVKHLAQSMRESGFLEPILCIRDPQGRLIVKEGQHRLLAAIEAQVPVLWIESEKDFDIAQLTSRLFHGEHRIKPLGFQRPTMPAIEFRDAGGYKTCLALSASILVKKTQRFLPNSEPPPTVHPISRPFHALRMSTPASAGSKTVRTTEAAFKMFLPHRTTLRPS